jgi:hypothetical protein
MDKEENELMQKEAKEKLMKAVDYGNWNEAETLLFTLKRLDKEHSEMTR